MVKAAEAVDVRPMVDDDLDQVLLLLQASLGWVPDDQFEAFFRWKHHANPAGRSPAWVAIHAGEIVGFRAFLRWRFLLDGSPLEAVRAVDTATRPDWQGRGLFRRLTEHGITELAALGVQAIFNTPNSQSRPGYLRMGWEVVGRVPVRIRPVRLQALPLLPRARVPADRWCDAPVAADTVGPAIDALPERLLVAEGAGLRTDRTRAHLHWRYGFAPLGYQVVTLDDRAEVGAAFFRVRRRGPIREATICDVFAPDSRTGRRLRRLVANRSGADVVVSVPEHASWPRVGPTLTWRRVAPIPPPPLRHWRLSLGDLELF